MTTTVVADALDALVVAARVVFPEDGEVTVYDGQPIRMDDPDVVVLGWSADRASVEINQEAADLGGGRSEVLTVAGLVSALRGDSDPDASPGFVRRRAVELLDTLVDALDADPTMGGRVAVAEFGFASAMDQVQSDAGASASIEFVLRIEVL